jgi:hypothetical protein
MRRLQAKKKKGKVVMCPVESSEGVASPYVSEDVSSMASNGVEIAGLVCCRLCHGDVATSSNVSPKAGGSVVDPALVIASSVDVVGVVAISEVV